MRPAAAALLLVMLAGCTPNPRAEIPAIVAAAMREAVEDAPDKPLCVDRFVAPWQPAETAGRVDTPAPPGFEPLRARGVFRGGGGIKGEETGGVAIRSGASCFALRGPLVSGDMAMIEVGQPGIGWNVWLRRQSGGWRAVMTTTSLYPDAAPPAAR